MEYFKELSPEFYMKRSKYLRRPTRWSRKSRDSKPLRKRRSCGRSLKTWACAKEI